MEPAVGGRVWRCAGVTRVVVPVRYPLSAHSRRTLMRAIEIAEEHDAELTILHVDLFQTQTPVTRTELKRSIEEKFGRIPYARYVIRRGFIVEETLFDEIAAERADIVVIGQKQAGRFRATLRRITGDPDIEEYLRDRLDCEIVTVT